MKDCPAEVPLPSLSIHRKLHCQPSGAPVSFAWPGGAMPRMELNLHHAKSINNERRNRDESATDSIRALAAP
jgi:hypothetical protein